MARYLNVGKIDSKAKISAPTIDLTRQWKAASLKKYGIGLADFDRMVKAQEGRCLICRRLPERGLFVDHDHETGKVRGLLCHHCNIGLGMFRDNETLLLRTVLYLRGEELP